MPAIVHIPPIHLSGQQMRLIRSTVQMMSKVASRRHLTARRSFLVQITIYRFEFLHLRDRDAAYAAVSCIMGRPEGDVQATTKAGTQPHTTRTNHKRSMLCHLTHYKGLEI